MRVPTTTHPPVARQVRSRVTQEKIFAACTEMVLEGGVEAVTVGEVAARAGVSTGTVYRRFGNKDLLLVAIQREHVSGYAAAYEARIAAADLGSRPAPADVVRTAVSCLMNATRGDTRLLRVFILLGTQSDTVREIGSESTRACGEVFRRALEPLTNQITHEDPDAAIDFAFRLVDAAWSHRVVHGENLESSRPLPWSELVDHLTRAVTLYLFGTLPHTRTDTPTSTNRADAKAKNTTTK
jgi:AcrR family transcriptional regulator